MMIISCAVIILWFLLILFQIKVNLVFNFRNRVIEAIFCIKYEHIRVNLITEYLNVPFNKMLFSFKRLKVENFYSENFCELIKDYLVN